MAQRHIDLSNPNLQGAVDLSQSGFSVQSRGHVSLTPSGGSSPSGPTFTGSATRVGSATNFGVNFLIINDLAWDPDTTTLFALGSVSQTPGLYTINTSTGVATLVGNYNLFLGSSRVRFASGLTYDGTNLYSTVTHTNNGRPYLVVVSKSGRATTARDMGSQSGFDQLRLAYDGTSVNIITTGGVYTVNTSTGAVVSRRTFSTGVGGVFGIEFIEGILYATFPTSSAGSYLGTINLSSGDVTRIGNVNNFGLSNPAQGAEAPLAYTGSKMYTIIRDNQFRRALYTLDQS